METLYEAMTQPLVGNVLTIAIFVIVRILAIPVSQHMKEITIPDYVINVRTELIVTTDLHAIIVELDTGLQIT